MNNNNEIELDLKVVFNVFKKNIVLICVVAICFGAAFFAYSNFLVAPKYKASATIIVNNKSTSSDSVNTSDLSASQGLADVYSIIIKSDTVLQKVIDNLGLSVTYESLSNSISVTAVNSTQVVEISMKDTDPEFAKMVISEVIKVSPPIIADKVEAGSVKVISETRLSNNGNPVSPNKKRNTIIGALIGFVLTFLIVLFKELLNNTFKKEEDIQNILNIPLLGVIPLTGRKGS